MNRTEAYNMIDKEREYQEEPQSEESKKKYLSLAEEKRQRKNSKRLAIFK